MKAEIISIGDELLIGQVVNTNASWIANQLNQAGVEVNRIITISDKETAITDAITASLNYAEIVILTGGLGPTNDDITKKTLVRFFNGKLILHQPTAIQLETFFRNRGIQSNRLNKMQAYIPDNCTPIINQKGTAPGMWFEKDNKIIISLPGVPIEMKHMISEYIIPKLKSNFSLPPLLHKTIKTFGIPESLLAEKISVWENNLPSNIKLAYLPNLGMVRLRISISGTTEQEGVKILAQETEKLLPIIGNNIYGFDDDTLEEAIGKKLKNKNLSLSVAESCTGGSISARITTVPGASAYFLGGIIAYSNELKINKLGVKRSSIEQYGAVSEKVAEEMATGIRNSTKSTYSISITGIAGPDGGTPQKPIGTTWIGIAGPKGCYARHFLMGTDRDRNIARATITALSLFFKEIKDL